MEAIFELRSQRPGKEPTVESTAIGLEGIEVLREFKDELRAKNPDHKNFRLWITPKPAPVRK